MTDDRENDLSQEMLDMIFVKYSRITGKADLILGSNQKLRVMVEDYKQKHGSDIPDAEILLDFIPFLLEKIEKNKEKEE